MQSGQAGRRLHDARGRAARAHRELAARAEVGDVGRVPAARGGGADDVRPDDRRLVDLHRHAGDPAGDVPDVRRGGREALRLARSARADDPHGRARRDGRRAAARGDDGRRRDPLRRGRSAPASSGRLETRYLDEATDSLDDALARVRAAAAEGRALSVGLLGNAADVVPRARGARRALRLRHRPDGGARSADRLRAAADSSVDEAAALRASDPDEYLRRARASIVAPRRGDARVRPARRVCFRLWQQPAR